jgi:Ubiquitin-conjugating enzyme
MESIRARRIEGEWQILCSLAEHNPDVLHIRGRVRDAGIDYFEASLSNSGAIAVVPACLLSLTEYEVTLMFPAFFPAVPIQAYVRPPLLHPNIHPQTGFVCLFEHDSPADGVIEALTQLQAVVSWTLYNSNTDHLMQPAALEQYSSRSPLTFHKLAIPEALLETRQRRLLNGEMRRQRLYRM